MSVEERDELILIGMAEVNYAVRRYSGLNYRGLDLEDLRQEAILSMLKAIDRFDPSRGVRFKTFINRNVVGAVRDAFRNWDHLSRRDREQVRCGVHDDVELVSLGVDVPIRDRDCEKEDSLDAELVIDHLDALPLIERCMIVMHYLDEWKLKEIGTWMGCNESRVSQLLTQARTRLRKHLETRRWKQRLVA